VTVQKIKIINSNTLHRSVNILAQNEIAAEAGRKTLATYSAVVSLLLKASELLTAAAISLDDVIGLLASPESLPFTTTAAP